MAERRLDEDDPNWSLTREGKRQRRRVRSARRGTDIDQEALRQHYADLTSVYRRRGLTPPPELVPPDFGYSEDPDLPGDWRDHW